MPSDAERIKERVDLADLVNEYVRLKPAGINMKALCPFHKEKTPSFMVNRERQFWHCFGCSRGGDVFTFIQEVEGIEFPEALRLLAKRAGIELTAEGRKESNARTRLLDLHKWATAYFMKQLASDTGKAAQQYLEDRQIDAAQQDGWGIGFAPDGWEHVSLFLKEKKFTAEEIFQAGLTVKSEKRDGWYERFRNRIIFPIADVHGSVIGFGGRTLDPEDPAKYINSPQTPLYDKSRVLYGLHRAKQAIREAKTVVLVEGYTDVIASHRADVVNAVGVSGTALTRDQLGLLKRFTNTIITAFDADLAGEAAAARGLDLALEMEMEIKAIRIPGAKDPDELVRENPGAWKELVGQARPFFDVLFEQLKVRHGTETAEGKKAFAKAYLTALAKIADPVEQRHYIEQLGSELHVDAETLAGRIPRRRTEMRIREKERQPGARNITEEKRVKREEALLQELLALLLHDPSTVERVAAILTPENIPKNDLSRLYTTLISLYTHGDFTSENLVAAWEQEGGNRSLLDQLFMRFARDFEDFPSKELERAVFTHARELKKSFLDRELQRVAAELTSAEAAGDDARIEQSMQAFQALTEQMRTLR